MQNNPDDLANQLVNKIKVWLRGELSEVRKNPLYEDDDTRESALLDGRYECAEGLLKMIKQWEKKEQVYVEPYGSTGSDVDYFHPKAKTIKRGIQNE